MSGNSDREAVPDEPTRPVNKGMLVAAGVLVAIPVIALMLVGTYAQETPKLAGFPFFFWYQMALVPVTAAMTYTAHRLVLAARGQRDSDGSKQAKARAADGGDGARR